MTRENFEDVSERSSFSGTGRINDENEETNCDTVERNGILEFDCGAEELKSTAFDSGFDVIWPSSVWKLDWGDARFTDGVVMCCAVQKKWRLTAARTRRTVVQRTAMRRRP